jgi:hypothetical protein
MRFTGGSRSIDVAYDLCRCDPASGRVEECRRPGWDPPLSVSIGIVMISRFTSGVDGTHDVDGWATTGQLAPCGPLGGCWRHSDRLAAERWL